MKNVGHLDSAIEKEKSIFGNAYEFIQELKQAAAEADEIFTSDELEFYALDWRKKNGVV